jgi:hypothetical protein
MRKNNPFQQMRLDDTGKKSYQWYISQIRKLGLNNITPNKALNSGIGKLVTRLNPGKMYLFMYDPKLKSTLPYYDTFPLIFPFNVIKGGFVGLNLHYLSPLLRSKLLNELLTLANTKTLTDATYLRMSWNVIGNYSRFPEVKPCVKQYLYNHVRSRFLEINPQDWQSAIFLPLDSFEKQSRNTVHRLSREIINA